jgi:hypothetical protein
VASDWHLFHWDNVKLLNTWKQWLHFRNKNQYCDKIIHELKTKVSFKLFVNTFLDHQNVVTNKASEFNCIYYRYGSIIVVHLSLFCFLKTWMTDRTADETQMSFWIVLKIYWMKRKTWKTCFWVWSFATLSPSTVMNHDHFLLNIKLILTQIVIPNFNAFKWMNNMFIFKWH